VWRVPGNRSPAMAIDPERGRSNVGTVFGVAARSIVSLAGLIAVFEILCGAAISGAVGRERGQVSEKAGFGHKKSSGQGWVGRHRVGRGKSCLVMGLGKPPPYGGQKIEAPIGRCDTPIGIKERLFDLQRDRPLIV
jgi:hypothetical protein